MNVYYAKSRLQDGSQPTVKEHLDAVTTLATHYGAEIDHKEAAELAGQLHDFGKYSQTFQEVLRGTQSCVDHAICGAVMLYDAARRHKAIRQNRVYQTVMEAISGHHDGLLEYALLEPIMRKNLESDQPVELGGKHSALSGKVGYAGAAKQFMQDFPGFRLPYLRDLLPPETSEIGTMLRTRMLFSCLVDADYTASARDEDNSYIDRSEQTDFDPEQGLKKLYEYRECVRKRSNADSNVNGLRDKLFEQCGRTGEREEGLFTLTAPTGTGKTLALLHFALRHCIATGKRRIIIVLPFLTLTEQNAGTYREIFPELLEDHSQSNLGDDARAFAARWRVPVIITTSVRFFETLFACKPTDCRKLHNIANSIVVFDEAQSLPPNVTEATLQAVNELCRGYHCTMVFSTATQPDFDALSRVPWKPTEIMPNHAELYEKLRRTQVEWKLDAAIPLEEIARQMAVKSSVCTIVNLRRHARKLYGILKDRCPADEVFFLTTDLCTAHRREVVNEISCRLSVHKPCRVVATQCIEAGVDFDFDSVYRALAPLDAIIQAAGRCNRNGRLPGNGKVVVFVPAEEGKLYPGDWYERAAQKVRYLAHTHPIDIHDPDHIKAYYRLLYQDSNGDKKELTAAIRERSFAETDKQYRLIENEGIRVIVPYAEKMDDYEQIRRQALEQGITPGLMKQAAAITVSVSAGQRKQLERLAESLCYAHRGRRSDQRSRFYVLFPQYEEFYTHDMGLQLPEQTAIDPFY